jgi:MFS family permease
MSFLFILAVTLLIHTAYKGSKVLIALYAIELGANPLIIGVLFSMYSLFSAFLAVYAGRLSDQLGSRWPMLFGALGLAVGLALPYFMPHIVGLLLSALLIGLCYIFYTVAVQNLIGSFGEGSARTRNYSVFSIVVGVTSLIGPPATGFAIDGIGHQTTYLLLAALPMLPAVVLLAVPGVLPRPRLPPAHAAKRQVGDLLRSAPLRRILLLAGILEAGNEALNFLVPIYGNSIGLSASKIGIVMGAYALALLVVRAIMPALARRSSEERVLSTSMFVAASACLILPFVASFPLLCVIAFVLGLGLGCGGPLSMVLAYNRSPQGRSGEAIGLRQTVNKATEVVMPLVFGTLSTALGMWPVFWLDAAMLAWGGWFMHGDASEPRVKGEMD